MKSFRTFNDTKRVPARIMEPVIDPAGWSPDSLRDVENWSYHITDADSIELIEAAESIRRNAIAYLGLGSYLGRPMSQNMQGHILGHVKDLGGDYADPTTRGYVTRAELR